MDQTPVRLLSLDGGGVRGLSSLYILKDLMCQIAREHSSTNPDAPKISPRPCEYFDLIGGTSTGGLIALMLGRLRMAKYFLFAFLIFSLLTMPFSNIKRSPKRSSALPQRIQKRNSMKRHLKSKLKHRCDGSGRGSKSFNAITRCTTRFMSYIRGGN